MIIYLIGYMAAGKTTIGRLLAGRLGYSFVDTDEWISNETGLSVSDYFKMQGENAFRLEEQRLLRYVSMSERTVVACGGGMPCFFDNINLMNQSGFTVWLNTPYEVLISRLKDVNHQRPLLENVQKLEDFVVQQLAERSVYYKQAKIHISLTSPEQIIEDIRNEMPNSRRF